MITHSIAGGYCNSPRELTPEESSAVAYAVAQWREAADRADASTAGTSRRVRWTNRVTAVVESAVLAFEPRGMRRHFFLGILAADEDRPTTYRERLERSTEGARCD